MINGDICGKNIILQVFRENSIHVPLKTHNADNIKIPTIP